MKLRLLGNTGLSVSEVSLGCGSFGGGWGKMDPAAIPKLVAVALDQGVNLFDTADSYGNGVGESRLGHALDSPAGREAIVVTKCGNQRHSDGSYPDLGQIGQIRESCAASLKRLKRNVMDVLLCHRAVLEPHQVEQCKQTFATLKDEGMVRFYGISSHDFGTIQAFFEDGTQGVCEVDYSILNRTAEKEILPFCRDHGIGVIVRSPFYRGILTGKYDYESRFEDSMRHAWNDADRPHFHQKIFQAESVMDLLSGIDPMQFALRFILEEAGVGCVIPGAKSARDVVHNTTPLNDCPAVLDAMVKVRALSSGWEF